MTPKIPPKNSSFLDWKPDADEAKDSGADCSKCHPSPEKKPTPTFQPGQPAWFLDTQKNPQPLNADEVATIQAWLEGKSPPAATAPTAAPSAPAPSAPAPKPGAPQDAAVLSDRAQELERQAKSALEPEKKQNFYQAALAFRLLAGDAEASTSVLNELKALYLKAGNETGQKFVAATQLWVEGHADEALKALAALEKEAQGESWSFHQAYASQRSLLLQSAAGEKLRNHDYTGAKPLLLEALKLTPSDQFSTRVLKLFAEHGDADLLGQSRHLADLQARREKLIAPPALCNTGHHRANDDPGFADFGDFSAFAGMPGVSQGPDLSAYRHLRHLTHPQKLQLHALDTEITAANSKYLESQKTVREILIAKTLENPPPDLAVIEGELLKNAAAFAAPDRSLPRHLAGEAYLAKKDYVQAAAALQAAVRDDPSHIDAQFALGKALFATGDFQGSREAYGEILQRQPQDVVALRYRADANSHYLTALDPKIHADEIAKVEAEMLSDRALLLTRHSQGEKEKLDALEKQLELLREGGDTPLEVRQETLAMMETMAKQYLALAETRQADAKITEQVRKEMNGLAARTFDLLAKCAKTDADPSIQKRAGLYEGYGLLAQGKIDEAAKGLAPYRKDFPEVEKILGSLEKSKLRMVNLAALDAWEIYNKEGSAIQTDAQNGLLGSAMGLVEGWLRNDGKDFRDDTKARWKGQVAFVAELRARIESGKADTILQAMELIQAEGPDSMKADASFHLAYGDAYFTGHPLGALIHFVDKLPPDEGEAKTLLNKTWDLERQNPAIETPYAFYTLVDALAPETAFNGTARQHMDALEGKGSFGRSVFKFVTSMSPETLAVDVGLMVASAGLGNLAKLSALSKLEKAGVTGYKAIFLAGAAGVGVEATALWAGNLGKEAMTRDPSKVFSQDHMLKTYGATLIMIGGLKGFGAVGETFAPRAAKSLGLVTEGGAKLSAGGKVLAWSIGHGSGLSGMIATSHLNQAAGLAPKPVGGWKEGLVHEVFGYVQFAVAHKIASRAFGGKLATLSHKQHSEIAVREAVVLAKSHADTLGFPATRNAKGEIVNSPERQAVVGLLAEASLNKPGFSGGKLAKLVQGKRLDKANDYLAEFALPLEYNKAGQLVAVARGELSPHAAAGIPAGKAKPPRKLEEADLYLKELGEKAGELLDKAAEWLFGPPNDGGFGGMQPALAGAYHMAGRPKAEPKGPPTILMSKKDRSGKEQKAGLGASSEPVNLPAAKAANDNLNYEVIPHTLKPGENFEATLGGLREHFQDPTKIIVIEAKRPIDKLETILERIGHYDPAARIEIHLPDGSVKTHPGKNRIDQLHPDALLDGNLLLWEAGSKNPRDLFRLEGKKGDVLLQKPEGLTRIEIQAEKAPTSEDIVFLLSQAKRLSVEIVVEGEGKLTLRATKEGFEVQGLKTLDAEALSRLVDHSVQAGKKVEVSTEAGKVEIHNGSTAKDTMVFTKDAKAALLAPERITLLLDKAPTGAELDALSAQGIRRAQFQDDPAAPNWVVSALEAMKHSKGMDLRALDPNGKVLWENAVKSEGDSLRTQSSVFHEALVAHAKSQGWKDRLAEMKTLLGPEGSRFDFAADSLCWAAARDLADASIPSGKKAPTIPPERFESWLKRGGDLAAFKHRKATEKGKASLAKELAPFAEGFKTDPAAVDGWSQTTAKVKDFLQKHPDNPALLAKALEQLHRESTSSEAFENNAYDLAKFFHESSLPHRGLENLTEFYGNSSDRLKLEGNFFGTFLNSTLGAKPEQVAAKKMISDAEELTSRGYEVTVEAIPTSKSLEGTTPDFAMTVAQGGTKTKYFVEVKKVASMTIAKGTKDSFAAELRATFNSPGKKDIDASLGTQLGKGLAQLNNYKGKNAGDNLVLNVHLDNPPPPYLREVLTEFLSKNCPNIAVRIEYNDMQSYSPAGSGRIERKLTRVEETIRADSASRYASYDSSTNFFAPSLPDPIAAE